MRGGWPASRRRGRQLTAGADRWSVWGPGGPLLSHGRCGCTVWQWAAACSGKGARRRPATPARSAGECRAGGAVLLRGAALVCPAPRPGARGPVVAGGPPRASRWSRRPHTAAAPPPGCSNTPHTSPTGGGGSNPRGRPSRPVVVVVVITHHVAPPTTDWSVTSQGGYQ